MVLQIHNQGSDRRRRVLLDSAATEDGVGNDASDRAPAAPRRQRRAYADEALQKNQLRLCDLIPKSWWAIVLVLLVPALMLYGIAQGYIHFQQSNDAVAATFALTGSGNLASWFASFILLCAMVGSLQVYLLRRHKLDDYRGRYKIWLVVAAWCAIASLDASSGLHRLLDLAARRMPADGSFSTAGSWWLLIAAAGTGVLGLRLIVEMRRSLLALPLVSIALVGYGSLLAQQLGWINLPSIIDPTLTSAMIMLGSDVAACLSIWLFARYCFLSAQRFGQHHRHDSAHRRSSPYGTRAAAKQADQPDRQEDSAVEEEEEEEEEYVHASSEEAEWEEDKSEDEQEQEDEFDEEEEVEDGDSQHTGRWGDARADEDYADRQEDESGNTDPLDGLTSEERKLLSGVDDDVQIHDPAAERERDIAEMMASDDQYEDGMDPDRWRQMTKRQRKKWRRRQRRAA